MANPMANKSIGERREIAAKSHATRKANKEAILAKTAALMTDRRGTILQLEKQISELEGRLENLREQEEFATVSAAINGGRFCTEEEIVDASEKWDGVSGVYFLISNGRVVYVGQSVNVYTRIFSHQTFKQFDRFAFIPCKPNMLNRVESLYIHVLRPPLNGNDLQGNKSAPIPLKKLLEWDE